MNYESISVNKKTHYGTVFADIYILCLCGTLKDYILLEYWQDPPTSIFIQPNYGQVRVKQHLFVSLQELLSYNAHIICGLGNFFTSKTTLCWKIYYL